MSVLTTKQIMEIIPHRQPFLLIDTVEENRGKTAYFAGINSAKFKRKVVPGDVLILETEIIKQKGPIGVGRATAKVGDDIACIAELTFAIS